MERDDPTDPSSPEAVTDEAVDDPDADLPWPDPVLIGKWWGEHRKTFRPDTRYLRSKPREPDALFDALMHGTQRQRAAAALDLAVRQPARALFEVREKGWVQQARLSQWSS